MVTCSARPLPLSFSATVPCHNNEKNHARILAQRCNWKVKRNDKFLHARCLARICVSHHFVARSFLLRVEDSIIVRSTGSQSQLGDSRASNFVGGTRTSQGSGAKILICTSSATQLDPAEKGNLMRDECGFCKRKGLSKNNCPAKKDGAFLHFVTTLEIGICQKNCQQLLPMLRTGRVEEES